jgi:hypothetical protein
MPPSLNIAEMASTSSDEILDSYLLIPCREDESSTGRKKNCGKVHSLSGWFEIENTPLRINTVFFIGDSSKLRTQLKKRESIVIEPSENEEENLFKGVSGMTFPAERADGTSLVVIWMPKFEWSIIDIETLSHECLHASVMVMRMSGVKSKIFTAEKDSEVDDEGLCYRQATMMTSLLKKLVGKQNRQFKKSLASK